MKNIEENIKKNLIRKKQENHYLRKINISPRLMKFKLPPETINDKTANSVFSVDKRLNK